VGNASLDHAFDLIYRTFSQYGKMAATDRDRHPEHAEELLERLGRPDGRVPNIVVTGSKGKGSTALYIAALWETFEGPVGLFTSPHLLDTMERIRVNRTMISEQEFAALFDEMAPHLRKSIDGLPSDHYIGPVGIFAAMAALCFQKRQVQGAVYETGRGARFDDVARVLHQTAVVTTILPEHLRELGPSLEAIAWHKAGVLSRDTELVVLGDDSPLLHRAVAERASELGIHPLVRWAGDHVQLHNLNIDDSGSTFDLEFKDGRRWHRVHLPSVGASVRNLPAAIATVELALGIQLAETPSRSVLAALVWPGRGEIIGREPFTVLDAGVRPESIRGLLKALGPFDRILLSIPDNKDRNGMVSEALNHGSQVYMTGCSNPRLSYHFDTLPHSKRITSIPEVPAALAAIRRDAGPESRLFFCGTISFIADVYREDGRRPL
jgi:dihydrofolate synthase/folylpolyglutamate synthase